MRKGNDCLPYEAWAKSVRRTDLQGVAAKASVCHTLETRLLASFGCVFAQFLQKPQQCQPFVFRKDVRHLFHRGCVLAKSPANQRPSLGCQFNLVHPAVVGVILARNEPFLNQPINRNTDRSRREPDLGADRIDRERSLMQQNFQYSEIGVAQFYPLDALGGVRDQRLKGFHKNEPDIHAAAVWPWSCLFPPHAIYLDANCIDANILYVEQKL